MFDRKDQIIDDIVDDVRPYLDALAARTGWNSEARSGLKALMKILEKKNYKLFVGHPGRYHLTGIGNSCLYDVPSDRKGFLTEFRGKRIRMVCVSSGRYERELMAGVVGITPAHLVTKRDKPRYVFPSVGDHEIAYLGRRYMLIKSAGTSAIELQQGSLEFIDLTACDFILIDGKASCPIATLKYKNDIELVGTLIGWRHGKKFPSITDAIRGMVKEADRFRIAIFR